MDDVIGKSRTDLLRPLLLAVVAATIVQAVSSFTLTQLLSKEAQRLIAEMRRRVQVHVGRLSVAYYDANKTGALVNRIMTDVEGVRNLVGTGLVQDFSVGAQIPVSINVTVTGTGTLSQSKSSSKSREIGTKGGPRHDVR